MLNTTLIFQLHLILTKMKKEEEKLSKIQKVIQHYTLMKEHPAKSAMEDIIAIMNGGESNDRVEHKDYYQVMQECFQQAFGCWLMANKNSYDYSNIPEENASEIWRDFQEYKEWETGESMIDEVNNILNT